MDRRHADARRRGTLRWAASLILAIALAAATPAGAQMPTPSQTWTRAWSDNGYGVTVFLPDDAKVTPLAQNPEIAKFDLGQDIFVTMMISQMEQVMPLRAICVQATRDANFRYTPAVLLKDANEQLKLADRDALRFLMMVGEKRSQQWIFGQTLTLLRPDVVLAFQLEAPASRYDRAIELFTRLTDRVQIANDHALALRHRELLKAGDAWLKQLNPDLIQSLAHGESWHRITRDGEDVGYLRFAVRAGEQLGVTGVQMKEQIHRISEPLILDSFNEFFESDDNNAEFWSYKVTHRPMSPLTDSVVKLPAPQPADAATPTQTWTDTGLRSIDAVDDPQTGQPVRSRRTGEMIMAPQIKVTLEAPLPAGMGAIQNKGRTQRLAWRVPPIAYLSQLKAKLLPYLLDARTPALRRLAGFAATCWPVPKR